MDKPRKRACVSCHTNKVACDLHLSGDGPCTRCKRLNNACVPREQRSKGTRKRRNGEGESYDPAGDALLLAAGYELEHRAGSELLLQASRASALLLASPVKDVANKDLYLQGAAESPRADLAAELLLGLASGSSSGRSPLPASGASQLDLVGLSVAEPPWPTAAGTVGAAAGPEAGAAMEPEVGAPRGRRRRRRSKKWSL